jgi:hypothetical protein
MPVPRMRAGRFISFLAGLACAAALAGCDSNPSPAPLPSESPPSASPSATSTPSPTPPAMPDAAKGTGERSAKAFVRYYIDALNFATSTGDTALLKAYSDRSCDSCNSVMERIRSVYDAGGQITSRGWTIGSMHLVPLQPARRPVVEVGVNLSPQVVVQRAGADAERFDGGKLPSTFHLSLKAKGWVVTDWDRSA